MEDLISVIVPVYNVEKYLPKCLDSIVNQTYQNLEIILVDDGSTDKSGQICDEYAKKDDRIKVINQQNAGVSSARNAGLDLVTGKYLCFVDSDDTVETNYVEELHKPMLEKEYDLVVGNIRDIYKNYSITRIHMGEKVLTENLKFDYQYIYNVMRGAWSKLYTLQLIKKYHIKFPYGVQFGEDHWFNLLYYKYVYNIKFVKIPLYNYFHRGVGCGLSQHYSEKNFYATIKRLKLQQKFYFDYNIVNAGKILNEDVFPALLASVSFCSNNGYSCFLEKARKAVQFFDYNYKADNLKQCICMQLVKHDIYFLLYLWGKYVRNWYMLGRGLV